MEYSSGIKLRERDRIKDYEILKVFDPGGFAFAGKARNAAGRHVFFKKYKRPGGSSPWLTGFISYQTELKRRIEATPASKSLCYEFIEFFERSKSGGAVPMRAFYQVFEWVEGGKDLRNVLDEINACSTAYDWNQRVVFARVMVAGINAIHRAGVIHTDLKPENFYLLPEPAIAAKYKLRVIDMDFSLLEGTKAPWHGQEGYVGTPGYMSPEHLAGDVPTKASDVFTLGLILGELLGSGHPAAPYMDTYDDQVKYGELRPVTVQRSIDGVADLNFASDVINGCFRPEAHERPTAEQLLMVLNGRLNEWDGKRPKTTAPPPPARPTTGTTRGGGPPTAPPTIRPPETRPEKVGIVPVPPSPIIPPACPAATGVELAGPTGQRIRVNIPTQFGRTVLQAWGPDYEKYMSREQFHLFKDAAGQWMIDHCSGATNATNANGSPLTAPIPVSAGMILTLGKTGKCPVTIGLA